LRAPPISAPQLRLNDSGEIVGQSAAAGQALHAFVWRGGGMEDLGTLPGDNRSSTQVLSAAVARSRVRRHLNGLAPAFLLNPHPSEAINRLFQHHDGCWLQSKDKRLITRAGELASARCVFSGLLERARASRLIWRTAARSRMPRRFAAHESPRTTKLYDRTSDEITLDEVERIAI
jgi:probable HAF family extracellular repeat protein